MNDATHGILNTTIVRDYVCAQCYGELVERVEAGALVVACPQHCAPGGFVTRHYATRRLSESVSELEEVARNYPQFDRRKKPSPAELAAALDVLF
jgi:hypothetical protein